MNLIFYEFISENEVSQKLLLRQVTKSSYRVDSVAWNANWHGKPKIPALHRWDCLTFTRNAEIDICYHFHFQSDCVSCTLHMKVRHVCDSNVHVRTWPNWNSFVVHGVNTEIIFDHYRKKGSLINFKQTDLYIQFWQWHNLLTFKTKKEQEKRQIRPIDTKHGNNILTT